MRYNEATELEATGEWLLRFSDAGFSEELTYVPSQLFKLGVAPIDVVDRLDWLRDHDSSADHEIVETEVVEPVLPEQEEEPYVENLEERQRTVVLEMPLSLDYDGYGAWEWAEPIEKMVEDAIIAVLDSEPGLHEFNELVVLIRPKKRTRGRRARTAGAVRIQDEHVFELVGQ